MTPSPSSLDIQKGSFYSTDEPPDAACSASQLPQSAVFKKAIVEHIIYELHSYHEHSSEKASDLSQLAGDQGPSHQDSHSSQEQPSPIRVSAASSAEEGASPMGALYGESLAAQSLFNLIINNPATKWRSCPASETAAATSLSSSTAATAPAHQLLDNTGTEGQDGENAQQSG